MARDFPNACTFVAGCVVEADYIYVASHPDEYDPREYALSRLYAYVGGLDGDKWFHHDVPFNVMSVCVKKASASHGRRLVSLSRDGDVEIYSNGDGSATVEKIDGDGVDDGGHGFLVSIREIGDTLFACGLNNQVYERDTDTWRLISAAPLRVLPAIGAGMGMLSSIDGTSQADLYTCGLKGDLFYYNGKSWAKIATPTDANLNCIRCISKDEVWVCGDNGTLLKGNARDGFRDVSSIDDNFSFWSLTKFQNAIYVATADEGLFCYNGRAIVSVNTGLATELWTYYVDSTADVLWSIGPKEIACFDGKSWARVDHPENPPA